MDLRGIRAAKILLFTGSESLKNTGAMAENEK